MRYPEHLLKLISVLKKLPGVGGKTAERFAFHLIDWPQEKLREMGNSIKSIKENLKLCSTCGSLVDESIANHSFSQCHYCDPSKRQTHILSVVGSPKDVFIIEETREYRGLYHVLGCLLSPLQGKKPDPNIIEKLKQRIKTLAIEEVILAFDSTLEGDATALFIKKELASLDVTTTRLALGLPMGSSLDLIDGGTLARAFAGRLRY